MLHRIVRRPVNRDSIEADARMAVAIARSWSEKIGALGLDLRELRVLELGPGRNLGPQLFLASNGAHVTVAEPYLASWDKRYHPTLYDALRSEWPETAQALDRVVASAGYGGELTVIAEPAERLTGLRDGTIDLVLSNAVLEHVSDLPAVCREMARITRLGGVNLHQIDFRWHRCAARPLDFLLQSDARCRRDYTTYPYENGNRWRPSEVAALFRGAGFEVRHTFPDEWTDPEYLATFLPELRRSKSVYRSWPEEDLCVLGALFELVRTDDPAVRSMGEAEAEIHRRRKQGPP